MRYCGKLLITYVKSSIFGSYNKDILYSKFKQLWVASSCSCIQIPISNQHRNHVNLIPESIIQFKKMNNTDIESFIYQHLQKEMKGNSKKQCKEKRDASGHEEIEDH